MGKIKEVFKKGWVKATVYTVGGFVLGAVAYGLLTKGEESEYEDVDMLSEPERHVIEVDDGTITFEKDV